MARRWAALVQIRGSRRVGQRFVSLSAEATSLIRHASLLVSSCRRFEGSRPRSRRPPRSRLPRCEAAHTRPFGSSCQVESAEVLRRVAHSRPKPEEPAGLTAGPSLRKTVEWQRRHAAQGSGSFSSTIIFLRKRSSAWHSRCVGTPACSLSVATTPSSPSSGSDRMWFCSNGGCGVAAAWVSQPAFVIERLNNFDR